MTEPDKSYSDVPVERAGETVQNHLDAGRKKIVVLVNDDEETCFISVWNDVG